MFTNTMQPHPVDAVRLIFEYEGNQVHLISQQRVEMVIPQVENIQESRLGYYIDTRDANNQPLDRVPAYNAFETSVEVFPERHEDPIIRTNMATPKGAFTVVVPISERTNHVTLTHITLGRPDVSLPGGFAASQTPASPEVSDIASFSLESR